METPKPVYTLLSSVDDFGDLKDKSGVSIGSFSKGTVYDKNGMTKATIDNKGLIKDKRGTHVGCIKDDKVTSKDGKVLGSLTIDEVKDKSGNIIGKFVGDKKAAAYVCFFNK